MQLKLYLDFGLIFLLDFLLLNVLADICVNLFGFVCLVLQYHYTGLFEMIFRVLTTCHLVLRMQPHVISFYGVTSFV